MAKSKTLLGYWSNDSDATSSGANANAPARAGSSSSSSSRRAGPSAPRNPYADLGSIFAPTSVRKADTASDSPYTAEASKTLDSPKLPSNQTVHSSSLHSSPPAPAIAFRSQDAFLGARSATDRSSSPSNVAVESTRKLSDDADRPATLANDLDDQAERERLIVERVCNSARLQGAIADMLHELDTGIDTGVKTDFALRIGQEVDRARKVIDKMIDGPRNLLRQKRAHVGRAGREHNFNSRDEPSPAVAPALVAAPPTATATPPAAAATPPAAAVVANLPTIAVSSATPRTTALRRRTVQTTLSFKAEPPRPVVSRGLKRAASPAREEQRPVARPRVAKPDDDQEEGDWHWYVPSSQPNEKYTPEDLAMMAHPRSRDVTRRRVSTTPPPPPLIEAPASTPRLGSPDCDSEDELFKSFAPLDDVDETQFLSFPSPSGEHPSVSAGEHDLVDSRQEVATETAAEVQTAAPPRTGSTAPDHWGTWWAANAKSHRAQSRLQAAEAYASQQGFVFPDHWAIKWVQPSDWVVDQKGVIKKVVAETTVKLKKALKAPTEAIPDKLTYEWSTTGQVDADARKNNPFTHYVVCDACGGSTPVYKSKGGLTPLVKPVPIEGKTLVLCTRTHASQPRCFEVFRARYPTFPQKLRFQPWGAQGSKKTFAAHVTLRNGQTGAQLVQRHIDRTREHVEADDEAARKRRLEKIRLREIANRQNKEKLAAVRARAAADNRKFAAKQAERTARRKGTLAVAALALDVQPEREEPDNGGGDEDDLRFELLGNEYDDDDDDDDDDDE